MNEREYLRAEDLDRLAELVFELAQQLHVERSRRIALERALIERRALAADEVARAQQSPAAREESRALLDESLERLMRILAAAGGPESPLR